MKSAACRVLDRGDSCHIVDYHSTSCCASYGVLSPKASSICDCEILSENEHTEAVTVRGLVHYSNWFSPYAEAK
jgi:hypothetical protein